jgi:hypothetical protein
MKLIKRLLSLILGSLIVWILLVQSAGGLSLSAPNIAQAGDTSPTPPPERSTTIKVSFTLYEWWLIRWSDNQVVCQVWVEHDGQPIPAEVQYFCGDAVLSQWLATTPCTLGGAIYSYSQCPGFYMHRAHVTPGERSITVKLAPPTVGVSISGCDITASKNYCDSLPSLLLTGEEPLPGEQIIRIQGLMDGQPFSCPGSTCSLPLPPTGPRGITVEFWADSSFGDSSDHFTAQVRTIPWGDFTSPDGGPTDQPKWYVDVISSQWEGSPLASCSETWSSFPPVGGPPEWLTTPNDPSQLKSSISYFYLAGALIQQGAVDASECPNNGLQASGEANECGLTKAQTAVVDWQNQFDTEIIQVANETNVPGQLLKNIFSRESQFWPGIFQTSNEVGLGQLTNNGADTALLWNSSFFSQFCPLVFKTETCERGYGNLTTDQQAVLRGAMVSKVNAACPDCPTGIDLSQANFSISVFARSLLANCEQVGQIIFNTTNLQAGDVSSYEDLWKFTLVNYNAGPGCLITALQTAYQQGQPLNWENVSSHLEPACQGAIQYVDDVSEPTASAPPQGTAPPASGTLIPGATSTATATPGGTLQPTVIPTSTPTAGAYPPPGTGQTPTPEVYP